MSDLQHSPRLGYMRGGEGRGGNRRGEEGRRGDRRGVEGRGVM